MIWGQAHTRIVLAVAGLGLGALAVSGYVHERERAVRAETLEQAKDTIIKQNQDDRERHEKDDAARDAAKDALVAAYKADASKQKTPVQITGWSQAQLEQAIRGIQITVPAPTVENPHPSASVTIPEASLPGLRDTIEKCKECDVKLTAAQQGITSRDEQMKLADQQIEALKTERDTWKQTAKGGTFWQRTKKAAKYLAIGAGVGYIAARH